MLFKQVEQVIEGVSNLLNKFGAQQCHLEYIQALFLLVCEMIVMFTINLTYYNTPLASLV